MVNTGGRLFGSKGITERLVIAAVKWLSGLWNSHAAGGLQPHSLPAHTTIHISALFQACGEYMRREGMPPGNPLCGLGGARSRAGSWHEPTSWPQARSRQCIGWKRYLNGNVRRLGRTSASRGGRAGGLGGPQALQPRVDAPGSPSGATFT